MDDLRKLSELMRRDWNRRVRHDYRFWMSDGYQSDQVMWETGQRDLQILLKGIELSPSKTFLEVGCGVGRLVRGAEGKFGRVIGLDVSEEALAKARELLGAESKVELVHGNGVDLGNFETGSIDVAVSFAALTSMPTRVIANYLVELHRVLKQGAHLRLQVYLGQELIVCSEDTLHLRCFTRENFEEAAGIAGFDVEWVEELVLPFQVSFKELGIEASIVSLVRSERAPLDAERIATVLLPSGEAARVEEAQGTEIESWMILNYAQQLLDSGDVTRAREALEFAELCTRNAATDITDILERIKLEVQRREASAKWDQYKEQTPPSVTVTRPAAERWDGDLFQRNLRVLDDRFPEIAAGVRSATIDPAALDQMVVPTADGKTIQRSGQFLDHPDKPVSAGEVWAKRALQDQRQATPRHLVILGLGGGYHLESLAKIFDGKISIIEPSLEVLLAAMGARDLAPVLERTTSLVVAKLVPLSVLEHDAKLIVRPQSPVLDPEFCGEARTFFFGRRGLSELKPMFAVVGPLEGGTLPIASYTTNSLMRLGQRTRGINLSEYLKGFQLLSEFVKEPARQATMQGNYIEMISQLVLESLTEKPCDILICMAQVPLSGRVLMELRRRGVITVLWFVEDYLRFSYIRNTAQYYDFVFTIQKGACIDTIKAAGAGEVHYLPTGCDPWVHVPLELSEEDRRRWGSPMSFVGAGYHNRQQVFATFADSPFKIWGTEWPGCRPFDRMLQEEGRRLSPEEYMKIFNATDVNINLHSSGERDGVDPYGDFLNPRTFELAGAGCFQLVDHRSLLPEVYEEGKEMSVFRSVSELHEQAAYFLAHPEERREIANRARERTMREHTYDHRLGRMLSIIYSTKYEHIRGRMEQSPWKRMIDRAEGHEELQQRLRTAYERGEEPLLDALVSDIVGGQGKLSDTEMKLLFLFHVRKQIYRMGLEEAGANQPK